MKEEPRTTRTCEPRKGDFFGLNEKILQLISAISFRRQGHEHADI